MILYPVILSRFIYNFSFYRLPYLCLLLFTQPPVRLCPLSISYFYRYRLQKCPLFELLTSIYEHPCIKVMTGLKEGLFFWGALIWQFFFQKHFCVFFTETAFATKLQCRFLFYHQGDYLLVLIYPCGFWFFIPKGRILPTNLERGIYTWKHNYRSYS